MGTMDVERAADGVCWLWFNRPRARNAIDGTVVELLQETFEHIEQDDQVRAVVIGGRGGAFSAGMDVGWMAQRLVADLEQGLEQLAAVFRQIEQCTKPLVAAIDGPAVGAGLLVAMMADLRIATRRASFGAPEVKLGIFPSLGLIPRLERLVGLGAAKQLVMLGEPWDAEQAARCGLVHEIVEDGSFARRVAEIAGQLAVLPSVAVRSCKEAFAVTAAQFGDWEPSKFMECWASPERQEAMLRFLAR